MFAGFDAWNTCCSQDLWVVRFGQDCDDKDLQEAWKLMKDAEAAEAAGRDLETMDDKWKARFVQVFTAVTPHSCKPWIFLSPQYFKPL